MKSRPVISTKEARRLLGVQANDMDDFQVIELVNDLSDIAKTKLKKKRVKKSKRTLGS